MKNTQKGRSMVEMLGVLAIIGVLSIGGIAGYTASMNRYRANQIMDAAAKVAVLAQTANQGQGGKVYAGTLGGDCTTGATDSGIKWSTVADVTGFCAEAEEGDDTVTFTLIGSIDPDVSAAISNIAGNSSTSTNGVTTGTGFNGTDTLVIRSN